VSPASPRIAPRPPEEWDDDAVTALRDAFGVAAADRLLADDPDTPTMPNVLATLLRHPALTGPFLTYNNVLLRTPTLEPRWRELVVLRVAWRTRSEYEWAQHVRMATRFAITADEVDAIAQGAEADRWSTLESDLLRATDELLDESRIHDDTWARLGATLDERQLIELTFVVGTYACLAMVFNSIGLRLDDELAGLAPLPAP
jgi:alkylhydroperoxidase family enzyme